MTRVVYVNGRYRPYAEASIAAEDRGFLFADAIYEVIAVLDGKLVDCEAHLQRLDRSLGEIGIAPPLTHAAWNVIFHELIRRNLVGDGTVYLQVSRGAGRREFPFPKKPMRPTIMALARRLDRGNITRQQQSGVAAISMPDIRWGRCDIKSVGLLPAVLAKQAAKAAGAYEAFLVDRDGFVTEGASSNVWIVTMDGALVTRPLSKSILGGITRAALLALVAREGLRLEERAFTLDEVFQAREAFVSSSSAFVMPVTTLDGRPIGNGSPGLLGSQLRQFYEAHGWGRDGERAVPVSFLAPA